MAITKVRFATKKEASANSKTPRTPVKGKIADRIANKKAKETPAPAPAKPAPATDTATPAMQKKKMVSKKTAYDIKEASNPKLTAGARKHYAMNAQAAMKNQKKK
jgi:hypothetical protein